MRIRVLGTGRNEVITKDNVKITIETSVAFRIINPIIAYYRLGHELNRAVVELVISSFRKILG
jgi:regulator of protease activity HflC (stomatin/prohibitin superfamily)